MAAVTDE